MIDNFGKRQLMNRFLAEGDAFEEMVKPGSPTYNKQVYDYYMANKTAFDDALMIKLGFGK